MQQKVKLTFERDGEESQMGIDGYVLVAWNVDHEGKKLPVVNTSEPTAEAGSDLVHAVGALALAMSRHPVESVQLMGRLVKSTLTQGMGMLEAASQGEFPEG